MERSYSVKTLYVYLYVRRLIQKASSLKVNIGKSTRTEVSRYKVYLEYTAADIAVGNFILRL